MFIKVPTHTFFTVLHYNKNMGDLDTSMMSSYLEFIASGKLATFYLNKKHTAGYGLCDDGELIFVWSVEKGQGSAAVRDAIEHGATYLDCFEGYLSEFYEKFGFVTFSRMKNWNGEDEPEILIMKLGE